jgi:hypothetical protein
MDWNDYLKIQEEANRQAKEKEERKKAAGIKENDIHGDCQYVWAPEKGAATVMYIAAMIFGSIFNARILIWIVATLVYFNFIDDKK